MRRSVLLTLLTCLGLVGFALAGPDAQAGGHAGCADYGAAGCDQPAADCAGDYGSTCAGDVGGYRGHRARSFRPVRGFFRACGKVAAAPFRGFRGRHHESSYSYEYHETGNVSAGVSARPRKVCRNGVCYYVN